MSDILDEKIKLLKDNGFVLTTESHLVYYQKNDIKLPSTMVVVMRLKDLMNYLKQ